MIGKRKIGLSTVGSNLYYDHYLQMKKRKT
jgi:hypothetical protein